MDIVLVTYNSKRWIEGCMKAIAASEGLDEKLNVYVVDNCSSDDSCELLQEYGKLDGIDSFHLEQKEENLGFGKANNVGAGIGKDDIVCFINVDTEVFPDTFAQLRKEVNDSVATVGAWEMRQIPFEHPKFYDPVTGETSWMSGAAFAVRREIFEQIGGFDERIFMYAEDVDISWRIRALGYTLKYCPKVVINHYSYQKENEVKPTQYLESIKNNLLLRYRFGNILDVLRGHKMFWQVFFFNESPFLGAKKQLFSKYMSHWKDIAYFSSGGYNKKNVAKFLGWDYEFIRDGAFLEVELPKENPLVSVIVRTCNRPEVLRETLVSLRNQTYRNIEVVVVEDGEPTAENMIKTDFPDLNVNYYATKVNKGRSVAGNIGLEMANGEYINFLDDDDLFFADHIETLVNKIQKEEQLAVYAFGFETPIEVKSIEPYKYKVVHYIGRYKDDFSKVKLCHHNFMPIQCILFSKKLYETYGGFDESLDYLEDWDLWVRYMQMTDYICVPKTTSIYRVPAEDSKREVRQKQLDDALETVRKKHENYFIQVSVADLVQYGEEGLCQKISRRFKFSR